MEPRSATSHGGCAPWQGLLLAASLLTFQTTPTTAQLAIELVPFSVAKGGDVLLLVHNLPQNTIGYKWFKGERSDSSREIAAYVISTMVTTPGPVFSDRETIYPNGSLLLRNVTQQDTGYYTLQALKDNFWSEDASGQFRVYRVLPKPFLTTNNSNPVEGEEAVAFTCEPEMGNTTYLWWRNGQSLQGGGRLQLSNGNKSLTIFNVTRDDTGSYECEMWNEANSNRSDPLTLNVSYGPDAPIISPPDSYFHPGTTLNLSCYAASNPPAQYSWLLNGSSLQSTQELSIPDISANNSGSYTCLASNPATGLNTSTVKNVTVTELVSTPSIQASNTTVSEEDSVVLSCLSSDTGISIQWIFNNQSLQLTERMKLSQNSSTLTINPVKRQDAGEYQCEVSNPVSSRRSDPLSLQVNYDPTQESSGLSVGAIVGIVIGVVAGVALIAALVYFLFFRKIGGQEAKVQEGEQTRK
ncbi:PREDICTED: carcinoembryonic antigen-related cell adhesion molecule 1 isoform X2 [Chinchilla lanigera]|uniref:Ig-like domain-containing protein n=1 Tax=Chinchilla lanigera TaxID=34839 RepID=A0A8C2UP23_CHILA|nr:PREDICTED: carcinoembryonic antigen-related cell adhesion molecule 1 isoform X2 [Chinchilla lanigera]